MPDIAFDVKVVDERIITIPATASAVDAEAAGDALKYAAQEGYRIVSMSPIQRDLGSQRDPDVQTFGVKIRMVK